MMNVYLRTIDVEDPFNSLLRDSYSFTHVFAAMPALSAFNSLLRDSTQLINAYVEGLVTPFNSLLRDSAHDTSARQTPTC